MSGTPTEAEVQTQWKNAVNVLEKTRAFVDDTVAGSGDLLDVLEQSLKGQYTPLGLAQFAASFRGGCSSLLSRSIARQALEPVLFEYGKILSDDSTDGFGGSAQDSDAVFRALRDFLVANGDNVATRAITFNAVAAVTATGNGAISRLTVDENGDTLEACTVERKIFRCIQDQNTGTREEAELFEVRGEQASQDDVSRGDFGSGASARINSSHASRGANGGSLLNNGSFDSIDSGTSIPTGWTATNGSGQIAQDTTNTYRAAPGVTSSGSLQINGGGGQVTLTQSLAQLSTNALRTDRPYFLRFMVNPTVGAAAGGDLTIRLGTASTTVSIASMSSGWQEVTLPFEENLWPSVFAGDGFDIEIDWNESTGGSLLIDDGILRAWDLFDGTYWIIRGSNASHTPWKLDDTLQVTDSGGAPGTGILQYWAWIAGYGHLPSDGTPSITDPT